MEDVSIFLAKKSSIDRFFSSVPHKEPCAIRAICVVVSFDFVVINKWPSFSIKERGKRKIKRENGETTLSINKKIIIGTLLYYRFSLNAVECMRSINRNVLSYYYYYYIT